MTSTNTYLDQIEATVKSMISDTDLSNFEVLLALISVGQGTNEAVLGVLEEVLPQNTYQIVSELHKLYVQDLQHVLSSKE